MRRVTVWAALAALTMAFGCGGTTTTESSRREVFVPLSASGAEVEAEVAAEASVVSEDALVGYDLTGLPPAPWSSAPLSVDTVPAPVLAAWASAPNRATCAPMAPERLGAGEGAEARVSEGLVEGGWAVEFDRRGAPGLSADGESCRRCGRGVFGIAGTRMSPDELVDEGDVGDVPTPTFADGSHVEVEAPAEGESVAAATLTVRGQGCVYQVWSFLGEDHVRELVDGLRLVEVRSTPVVAAR